MILGRVLKRASWACRKTRGSDGNRPPARQDNGESKKKNLNILHQGPEQWNLRTSWRERKNSKMMKNYKLLYYWVFIITKR